MFNCVKNFFTKYFKFCTKYEKHNLTFFSNIDHIESILHYPQNKEIKCSEKMFDLVKNFKTCKTWQESYFEKQHDFMQFIFPNDKKSKYTRSDDPYVEKPEEIKDLLKNDFQKYIDLFNTRIEVFVNDLKSYQDIIGFDKDPEINPNVSRKFNFDFINGKIDHNNLRLTRVIESCVLMLKFSESVRDYCVENEKSTLEFIDSIINVLYTHCFEFAGNIGEYQKSVRSSDNKINYDGDEGSGKHHDDALNKLIVEMQKCQNRDFI